MAINPSKLLEQGVNLGVSDIHLTVGMPPVVRINRKLSILEGEDPLSADDIMLFLSKLLTEEQSNIFEVNKEVDFSVALSNKARFRVNAYYQKGYPSAALRLIPMVVPPISELNLPETITSLTNLEQGLILVVGPTGHGKSTTIASMIDHINNTKALHIITIEDPIEYIFTNQKSLIHQREMFLDSHSWSSALKAVLRQDPDVVFVGEMRDLETMEAGLTIAETGHLVFATLHTNSAAQSIDRIINSFPEHKQKQVTLQLSQTLEAIISQRLLKSEHDDAIPAVEIMIANDAIRNLIRENKSYQIDNVINTSSSEGMLGLDASLALLVQKGEASAEEALKYAYNPEYLRRILKGVS